MLNLLLFGLVFGSLFLFIYIFCAIIDGTEQEGFIDEIKPNTDYDIDD